MAVWGAYLTFKSKRMEFEAEKATRQIDTTEKQRDKEFGQLNKFYDDLKAELDKRTLQLERCMESHAKLREEMQDLQDQLNQCRLNGK